MPLDPLLNFARFSVRYGLRFTIPKKKKKKKILGYPVLRDYPTTCKPQNPHETLHFTAERDYAEPEIFSPIGACTARCWCGMAHRLVRQRAIKYSLLASQFVPALPSHNFRHLTNYEYRTRDRIRSRPPESLPHLLDIYIRCTRKTREGPPSSSQL